MLQSIQYGSGPPTYVYSNNAVGASNSFFHVFASQMSGYDPRREKKANRQLIKREEKAEPLQEAEQNWTKAIIVEESPQEAYQKEYGKRELFLWKQR